MRSFCFLFQALSLISICQAEVKPEVEKPEAAKPETTKEVTIRVLNKITGQTTTLKTPLLKPIRCGHLILRPRACFKKKLGLAHTVNWSFIEAWVQQTAYQPLLTSTAVPQVPPQPIVSLIFSSWMNSASPNFSHPDYGITIQDCQDVTITPPKPLAESSPEHQKNAE